MQIIEAFDVQDWDGGDRHNHTMFVLSEAEAKAYTKNNPHSNYHKRTFVFYDTIAEGSKANLQKIKQAALAKLSNEEKLALGLAIS